MNTVPWDTICLSRTVPEGKTAQQYLIIGIRYYVNGWLHLAECKLRQHKVEEGRLYIEKALKLDPDDVYGLALKHQAEK